MRRLRRATARQFGAISFERLEDRSLLAAAPMGTDLLVNSFLGGYQSTSAAGTAIALSPGGDGVVVFEGRGAGDRDGVFAHRISAAGVPIGADFRVNQTVQEFQGDASVAIRADGSFVVAWAGRGSGDQDGVFMRLFTAAGAPITGEILVNQTTAGKQGKPALAIAPDGTIIVAWEGSGAGDAAGIFVRRFSASGAALAGEILVNDTSSFRETSPALAMGADGSFLVAWTARFLDGSGQEIMARRFDAAGRFSGAQFAVNSNHAGDQQAPAVAALNNGQFEVVWSSFGAADAGWDVKQARVSASGQAAAESLVHSSVTGDQTQPKIASAPGGSTIVTWTSAIPNGTGREVLARDFSTSGQPQQTEFAVPAISKGFASGHQETPAVAVGAQGAVIAWSGQGPQDRQGVYVRAVQIEGAGENRPPNLAPIPEQTVEVGTLLTFTATATDPDGDQLTFSLDPDSAPAGATIDPVTGVFRWTPTTTQAGSFTFRVLVTDNGEPPLSDSETVTVVVVIANRAPNLTSINNMSVAEGSELVFTATATDPDADQLTFALDPDNAPAGATIDPITGVFRWTPAEAQGPGTFTVRVLVIDDGTPALADSETFTITVTEVNRAPDLVKPANRSIEAGGEIVFTATATDPDLPANSLQFMIDPDSQLPGVTINAQTGEFRWSVPDDQPPGDYQIRLLVVDNGDPSLADSETFTVTVSGESDGV